MNGRIACGSMVLFLSFSQKCGSQTYIFVKKDAPFRPAGGDMSFRVRDRVTRVIDKISAVSIQMRHGLD
jgi:hypothetical protein